ncbi:MAG: transglutaminase-like domain-containing protein, partial [Candidatus Zixiibacteriota bacterium]
MQAALFLIGNMDGHSYVTYRFVDTSDSEVELDATGYPDYKALLAAVDSIESVRGEIDYERLENFPDLEAITADFLITQIDLAFAAWRDKPWAQSLTFDRFCRYVLPYRGSNEPLEQWRPYFLDKYADIEEHLTDPADPVRAAALIDDDIRSWFKFDPRYYFHPTDQGISQMLQTGLGRCEDMTNITIYALRANGIAVTSDYTPYWANTGNNHAWNAIVTGDGRAIPFMGAEANPGEYALHNKAAKVYRKAFDRQPDNLIFQPRKQEAIPRWLAGKNYVDVTPDYVDVCDVAVGFSAAIPDSVDIAYLCVFNDGEFKPIHWGRIENKQAVFTDMGSGIVYLPAGYQNERVVPLGAPFILHADCSITELIPDHNRPTAVSLVSVPTRAQAASTETIRIVPLTGGQEYELFYWSDGWQ